MMQRLASAALAGALAFATPALPAGSTVPISQMPSASTPLGDEAVPIVQGGVTKQAPAAAFGIPKAGSVAPTPVARYQLWWDESTSPPSWKVFDGSSWVSLGTLDTSAHVWSSVTALAETVAIPQPSGSAQASSNIASLGASGLGSISVPSVLGWPLKGYLRTSDNGEYMAYVKSAVSSALQITGRAQCGSTGTAHSNGVAVVYMAMMFCPSSGSPAPVLAIDGSGNQWINGAKLAAVATSGNTADLTTGISGLVKGAAGALAVQPIGYGLQIDGAGNLSSTQGRTHTIVASAMQTLSNSDCGASINAPALSNAYVTLPANPAIGCEFVFNTTQFGFVIDANGQVAHLPGLSDTLSIWPVPLMSALRSPNSAVAYQFNGTSWEQVGMSAAAFGSAIVSANTPMFRHGQVYFSYDIATSQFKLCPYDGPGGLIVDGVMRQVPGDCLTYQASNTNSSQMNYFYATNTNADAMAVCGAADNGAGKIRINTCGSLLAFAGDTIFARCVNIAGAWQANVNDAATVIDSTHFDLLHTSSSGLGTWTSGGTCRVLRLSVSATGYAIASNGTGVQVISTQDTHYTLVGMAFVGASHAVNDSATKRDVASWFNKKIKTCRNSFTADRSTSSTTFAELNSEIRCEFVTFGENDLTWRANGMVDAASGNLGCLGVAFDIGSAEPEQICTQRNATGQHASFSLSGTKSGLSNSIFHLVTLVGQQLTSGSITVYGTTPVSTLEISIPQ